MSNLPANRAQRRTLRRSSGMVGLSVLATTGLLGAYLGSPRLGRSYAAAPVQCGANVTSTALLNAAIDAFIARTNSCDLISITADFAIDDDLHHIGTSSSDVINAALTIDGVNGHEITAGGNYRGFIGFVKDGITISNLTMRGFEWANGDITGFGGAAYNYFDLSSTNSTFTSNSAPFGGALAAKGKVTVTGAYLGSNSSTSGAGGAVWSKDAASVTGSTFSGNSASGHGGGVWSFTSSVTVADSYFVGNSAAFGGAAGAPDFAGSVTITGSTFASNTATYGGGAVESGYLTLLTATNSTFTGNSAGTSGGAMLARSGAAVQFSTVVANSVTSGDGGGLFVGNGYPSTVTNSVFWNNTADSGSDAMMARGGSNYDLTASFTSFSSGTSVNALASGSGIITGDPQLADLDNYGGFTVPGNPAFTIPTMMPLAGSPVIAAANTDATGFPTTDERGTGFPRVSGTSPARADMGAVEYVQTITVAPNPPAATVTFGGKRPTIGFTATTPGPTPYTGPWVTAPKCVIGAPVPTATINGTAPLGVGTYTVTCAGGDAGAGAVIVYQPGTLTVEKATPVVKYTGTTAVLQGDDITPASSLSPSGCTGPVTYDLTSDPTGGSTVPFPLSTPTMSTDGWIAGTYTVTVHYDGDANCNAATGTGRIVVALTSEVEGEGYYTSPVGKARIDFELEDPNEHLGHPEVSRIKWTVPGAWQFIGTLNPVWTKTGIGAGTATGTGTLSKWVKVGRYYTWVKQGTAVPVTIRFTRTVKKTRTSPGTPGTFALGFTGAGYPQLPGTNAPMSSGEIEFEMETNYTVPTT